MQLFLLFASLAILCDAEWLSTKKRFTPRRQTNQRLPTATSQRFKEPQWPSTSASSNQPFEVGVDPATVSDLSIEHNKNDDVKEKKLLPYLVTRLNRVERAHSAVAYDETTASAINDLEGEPAVVIQQPQTVKKSNKAQKPPKPYEKTFNTRVIIPSETPRDISLPSKSSQKPLNPRLQAPPKITIATPASPTKEPPNIEIVSKRPAPVTSDPREEFKVLHHHSNKQQQQPSYLHLTSLSAESSVETEDQQELNNGSSNETLESQDEQQGEHLEEPALGEDVKKEKNQPDENPVEPENLIQEQLPKSFFQSLFDWIAGALGFGLKKEPQTPQSSSLKIDDVTTTGKNEETQQEDKGLEAITPLVLATKKTSTPRTVIVINYEEPVVVLEPIEPESRPVKLFPVPFLVFVGEFLNRLNLTPCRLGVLVGELSRLASTFPLIIEPPLSLFEGTSTGCAYGALASGANDTMQALMRINSLTIALQETILHMLDSTYLWPVAEKARIYELLESPLADEAGDYVHVALLIPVKAHLGALLRVFIQIATKWQSVLQDHAEGNNNTGLCANTLIHNAFSPLTEVVDYALVVQTVFRLALVDVDETVGEEGDQALLLDRVSTLLDQIWAVMPFVKNALTPGQSLLAAYIGTPYDMVVKHANETSEKDWEARNNRLADIFQYLLSLDSVDSVSPLSICPAGLVDSEECLHVAALAKSYLEYQPSLTPEALFADLLVQANTLIGTILQGGLETLRTFIAALSRRDTCWMARLVMYGIPEAITRWQQSMQIFALVSQDESESVFL